MWQSKTCGLVVLVAIASLGASSGAGSTAFAQQYRPGDRVVVIHDAHLLNKSEKRDKVWPGLTLKVQDVNGKYLLLSNGKPGWLDKSHVIPLDRRAIDRLTSLIKASSRDVSLYQGRALVWRALGEVNNAIGDFNEAIRLSPSAASYNGRGNSWRYKKEYDKAISDYNEALRLDPKSFRVFINRGSVWYEKKEYDKAIRDYNEALRLDPKNLGASGNLAWLEATCQNAKYRDGKSAIENARKSCELTDWKHARAIITLAAAYAEAGDFEKAKEYMQKADAIAPEGNKEMRDEMRKLFAAGRAYHETVK